MVLGIITWSHLGMLRVGSWLCLWSMLACLVWGVLTIAGLTRPHTFQFGSLEHGGCGDWWGEGSLVLAATTDRGLLGWSLGLKTPNENWQCWS